mmetsp:Transcript_28594/g.73355  ORF Transcript_28594/g.73355 Transcript_28594/m.73355 type:complete len:296 (-) Transcript_28594:253-1140(-)
MQEEVKKKFGEVGISIVSEGEIGGADIDSKKFIDQHYYAIASKATILPATELNVPADKFKATFGEEWEEAKKSGRVLNALDFKNKMGWTAEKLDEEWSKTSDKADPKTRIKFGGGFYCGKLEVDSVTYYTFNAFFMTMRGKFTDPAVSIHYYVVEFDSDTLKWADFRGKVLGPTNPAEAPVDSLRGICNARWQDLGLKSAPDTGDNAVHASASPFEGLAERTNWLADKYTIETDEFAKALTAEGISAETIKAWSVDPQVKLAKGDEKKGSLFDQVEDMDFAECVAKLKELNEAAA